MADLAAFLTARLDEDQAVAEKARDEPFPDRGFERGTHIVYGLESTGLGLAYQGFALVWDPARVLAEITTKRKHLEAYGAACQLAEAMLEQDKKNNAPWSIADGPGRWNYITTTASQASAAVRIRDVWERVLRLDAILYADHAEFQPEWSTT